jgi:hypothetical protein
MLRRRLSQLQDEEGTSMVEVMVGMAMGMVVFAGLAMLLIVTMHGNARISARVEASDNARVTMTRIITELHSACVSPTEAPVQPGSNATTLIFTHGTYGQQSTPSQVGTRTTITYRNEQLWEKDGTAPERLLLSNVALPDGEKVFTYENPTRPEAIGDEVTATNAKEVILVEVAFTAKPKYEPVSDAGAATEIRNSATLRLTPPLYSSTKVATSCQ